MLDLEPPVPGGLHSAQHLWLGLLSQLQEVGHVLPPQGGLVATPRFSGVGEPALVRGDGLEPGKSYKLNWTRVIGNQLMGPGAEQFHGRIDNTRVFRIMATALGLGGS